MFTDPPTLLNLMVSIQISVYFIYQLYFSWLITSYSLACFPSLTFRASQTWFSPNTPIFPSPIFFADSVSSPWPLSVVMLQDGAPGSSCLLYLHSFLWLLIQSQGVVSPAQPSQILDLHICLLDFSMWTFDPHWKPDRDKTEPLG